MVRDPAQAGNPPGNGYATPKPTERIRLILSADLTTGEKLLLIAMADHLGRGEWVWPSQQTLGRMTSQHEDHVRRLIRRLERHGIVFCKRRGKGLQYRIDWQRLESIPGAGSGEHRAHGLVKGRNTGRSARQNTLMQNTSKGTPADAASEKPGKKRESQSRGGWPGGNLEPSEFQSLEQAEMRFREAVGRGWVAESDQLRFLTLWLHVGRSKARTPGGLFTKLTKAGDWQGTNADEAKAREHIRQQRLGKPAGGLVNRAAAGFGLPADLVAAGRYADDEP